MNVPDSPVAARKNRRLPTMTTTTTTTMTTTMTTTTESKVARDNKDDPVHGSRSRHPRTNPFQSHKYKYSFLEKWTRKGSKGSPLGTPRWVAGIPIVLLLPMMIIILFWKSRDPVQVRTYKAANAATDDLHRSPKPPSPLVCSHQLLNPPMLPVDPQRPAPQGKSQPPPDGSLDAMSALWHTGGVTCFDIDVVVLSDGMMLASHPRRLGAALAAAALQENQNPTAVAATAAAAAAALSLEEHTLESIQKLLGLRRYGTDRDPTNLRSSSSSSGSHGRGSNDASSCPFPLFDEEVLPRFAGLVRGIPGAFSPAATTTIATSSLQPPWALRGPLLNIDLKLGPYLTESRVLDLVKQITLLGLEEHVAICVTAPPPTSDTNSDTNNDKKRDSSLDLLEVMHRYNTEGRTKAGGNNHESNPAIPLGLVLRDRVPEDASVDRVRQVVEDLYPESIKAMVPSFKFSEDWYRGIRHHSEEDRDTAAASRKETALWKLPMTVWTIDSREDYRYVSSLIKTKSDGGEYGGIPFASAVVANKPMELLE